MIPFGAGLIVLNGASSAGKTRTAAALLELLGPPWSVTGLDQLLERVQPFGPEPTGVVDRLRHGARVLHFQLTDGRLRLFQRLHQEVADLVTAGQPHIMETALMDSRALRDAAIRFAPLGGYFIGLKPPLAVAEAWEAARGDRPIGQARRHYEQVHVHGRYDLLLDPSTLTPEESARAILQRCQREPPEAFQHLLQA